VKRNSKGQFVNGYWGRQSSQNNPDRKVSILEQIASDTLVIECNPDGEQLDKPKKVLKYNWLIEVREAMLAYGYFYNPKGKQVAAVDLATKTHYSDIITTAEKLDKLDFQDLIYLANYKREGLLENPQLTIIKKHFRQCKNFCSIIDVYAPQFAMRGWQREAVNRKEFIVAVTGGRARGASFVAMVMTILDAMTSDAPKTITVGRKDKASNRTSTFIDALAFLTIPEFAMMVKRVNRSTMTIEFINGSSIIFVGYYTDLQRAGTKGVGATDKPGGGTAGATIEELTDGITEEDFNTIQSNIRGVEGGQIRASMNPGPPNHWFKTQIMDSEVIETTPHGGKIVKFSDNKNAIIYEKTAKDNEWLMENDPDYWQQLLAIKSETQRARYALGEWRSPEGAVYPDFYAPTHVVSDPSFNILEKMQPKHGKSDGFILIGGDWGARDPTAIVWMYCETQTIELPTKKNTIKTWSVFVYRQFYMYNCNREHVPRFVASFPDSKLALKFIGGHDGVSEVDSLKALGIKATHNQDKRSVGEYQKETLAEFTNTAIGEGRFHILKGCVIDNNTVDQRLKLRDYKEPGENKPKSLEDELPMQVWETKNIDGAEVQTGKLKDGNDHACDATLNGVKFLQNKIDFNNEANLMKVIKVLNSGRG
jgi:PBSX family phage terminase large subunit